MASVVVSPRRRARPAGRASGRAPRSGDHGATAAAHAGRKIWCLSRIGARHSLTHRREIRNLASAFVGEIAAVLHLIETHDVVSMLERALDAPDRAAALPNLTLPPFTIYTVDAARLDELPFPAPRKIAYFYAQIASIQDDLARLAAEPVPEGPAGGRLGRIRSRAHRTQ